MNSIPLLAGQDNHLWLLHNGRRAPGMDPGDAQPVPPCLRRDGLQLGPILVTHHHPDHIGVVQAPRDSTVAGARRPARRRIPEPPLSHVKGGRIAERGNPRLINYIQLCKELRELELDALTQG